MSSGSSGSSVGIRSLIGTYLITQSYEKSPKPENPGSEAIVAWNFFCQGVLCRVRNIEVLRLAFLLKSAVKCQMPDWFSVRLYISLQISAISYRDLCGTIHAVRSMGLYLYPTSRNGMSHVKVHAATDGQCIHGNHRFSLPDRKLFDLN